MSYGQNGINGSLNGYLSAQLNHHGGAQQEGGRRVRRAGGYGGFFESDLPENSEPDQPLSPESPDPYNPPSVPSWRRRDELGTERSRQDANGLRPYGTGPGARQIEG